MLVKYDPLVTPFVNKHSGVTFQPGRYGQVALTGQPESRTRYQHQFTRMHPVQRAVTRYRNLSPGEKSNWNTFAAAYPQACKNPDSGFLTGYQNFIKRQNYLNLNFGIDYPLMVAPSMTVIFNDPCVYALRRAGSSLFIDYEFTNWLNDIIVSLYASYKVSPGRVYQNTQSRYVGYITNNLPVSINYGNIYNWFAMSDVRNIANGSFRVPTKSEILQIFSYYDSNPIGEFYTSGYQLKESGLSHWNVPNNLFADNASDCTLRGGGERDQYIGEFYGLKDYSNWWLSSIEPGYYGDAFYCEKSSEYIWPVYLNAESDRSVGWYIRLIRYPTPLSHGQIGSYTGNDGKVYPTVAIGLPAIEILSANLAETKFSNGDYIPGYDSVFSDASWAALTGPGMCAYNNDSSLSYSASVLPLSLDITELYEYNFGFIPSLNDYVLFRAIPMAQSNGQFFDQIKQPLQVQ